MSLIPITKAPDPSTLSPDQQSALKGLHKAAQQFEGVFLGMLFKEMRATVPTDSVFGKESNTESMFSEMLDQQRAQSMAASGNFGIAKVLESQLRDAVLSNAGHEAKAGVPQGAPL
jgi:flagellar protein FlgJ